MTVDQLQQTIMIAPYVLPIVLIAFALHEMAHAFVATAFGDPTPREYGRVTLNPIPHLDPVGTIMLVVSFLLFGFPMGFAVTPVNDSKMRRPRLHGALTSLAGPLTNIVLMALFMVLMASVEITTWPEQVQIAIFYGMLFNAFLAVFNLLPIPPLDGGRIVGAFMKPDLAREWRKLDEYGIFIIIAMVLLLQNQFGVLMSTLQQWLITMVGGILGAPLLY